MAFSLSKFRPTKEDWLLVLAEPRQTSVGLIQLPDAVSGVEKVGHGGGRIVSISPRGKIIEKEGLKPGQRIVYRDFVRFAHKIENMDTGDERWPDGSPKHYFMMSAADIMGTLDEDADISVLSGRPQVPHKE